MIFVGELNQTSKTAQVLKETVESLEEIERMFTEGVTEAGERTRTAGNQRSRAVGRCFDGDGTIRKRVPNRQEVQGKGGADR